MAVTNYYTVNGEIIGEKTAGSPRVDYLTDALGSVTATVNQSAQVVNTYRYKPHGTQLAKTGTGADPAFGWVGTHGIRPTQKKFSDFYIRARHVSSTEGRWTTADPFIIYPWRGSYFYAETSPVLIVDLSGLFCGDLDRCCDGFFDPNGFDPGTKVRDSFHCNIQGKGFGTWKPFTPGDYNTLVKQCASQGTCSSLLADLDRALTFCEQTCGHINKEPDPQKPGGYGDDDPWAAQTLCCPGTNIVCGVFYCDLGQGLSSGGDACWMKCTYEHEQRHVKQCKEPLPNVGDVQSWKECGAYRVSVNCLFAMAQQKCTKSQISSAVRARVQKCTRSSSG